MVREKKWLNTIGKKADLPFLPLAATQVWESEPGRAKEGIAQMPPGVWVMFDPTNISFGPK